MTNKDTMPGFASVQELHQWAADKAGMTLEQYEASIVQEWEEISARPRLRTGYIKTPIPQKTRIRIFCRDLHECRYCGARDKPLCIDHVVPEVRGGTMEDANLATACKPCNLSKGSKTLEEWRASKT